MGLVANGKLIPVMGAADLRRLRQLAAQALSAARGSPAGPEDAES